MTTELDTNLAKTGPRDTYSYSGNVCMHVLTTYRADARVRRSATALKDAGFSVSVVDIVDTYSHAIEEIDKITVRHVKVSSTFLIKRFRRWAFVKAILLFIRSVRIILQCPSDIYHAHDFTALPACYIAARLRRKPLIFDAHELPLSELDAPHRHRLRAFLSPILTRMLASCAGGIGASPFYAQVLQERYHISKIALLRNVPPYKLVQKSDLIRQRLELDPSTRIVLYQGNIQQDRHLDIIVRAAAFLEEKNVLVMLGKGIEPTLSEIKALIASEGVAERVRVLPPVPYHELLDWTSSADLGLTLIPANGTLNMRTCLPNKLFEYLMAGLPILTSPMDAVAPLITSYDVGQVVLSLEPVDLAVAINTMLKDRTGLTRMHLNALEIAQSKFCWEKELPNLLHLYRDILATQSKN